MKIAQYLAPLDLCKASELQFFTVCAREPLGFERGSTPLAPAQLISLLARAASTVAPLCSPTAPFATD
jgi:hypothetical protein